MILDNFQLLCLIWIIIGIGAFVLLQFITAPYGRHHRLGWGIQVANRLGWLLMEAPSFMIILYFLLKSNQSPYAIFLSVLWLIHYFNRTFIYPFRIRTKGKKMPLIIVLSAILFNTVNAGLNGYYLAFIENYSTDLFESYRFYIGILLFVLGFFINQKSDHILIHLRKPDETDYKIPFGFLFNYVSCPNLLGEIIQWSGFVILAGNLPSLSFLVWTLANLIPRAKKHHHWYLQKFENYPPKRKILFPKIW